MRTFTKVQRNRDVYHPTSVALDAWVKWSQEHTDKILTFAEWMDMPYEDKTSEAKER